MVRLGGKGPLMSGSDDGLGNDAQAGDRDDRSVLDPDGCSTALVGRRTIVTAP